MNSDVLVVGSANADLVVAVDRRPGGGETVLAGDTVLSPGGKGANTAVAAGRLGADVALLGAVGDDPYGRLLLDSLRAAGVDTGLVRTSERPTGIAYITVTPDGENSILVSPGANSSLEPADVDAVFDGVEIMVVSLEVPLPTVEHAVARAAEKGVRVLLNLSPAAKLSPETLARLDVLLVNEHEAAWLTGPGADFRKLLDLGPRAAVVTLGAAGAVVVEAGSVSRVESPKVEAVDTTGAGDAFAGALAASLADGADLVSAAKRAVRVAAFSVTRHGAQPSYPTAADLGE
ncbi:ribokinase [Amycolatopsis mediterranei S699]|uniref:Ribokinase n=1 Tax=Amycolatopsis mediterranei (strain S699) TaxID=713604 RepID=A0A9R0PKV1_AMYMS|nr:ribokinase [Amycolatopsis mediterranei]AEK48021.1 ribokinase [Amycolatopsis mediterranei S699]AFO82711.1 ribokinase [Amycolatopsis mediterranei S699]AGT89841.1 ribokinase [Amycolatopsis mediterranei RB]KDO12000.1 ribokinase [Amycolatopsis mediterranei]KDU91207.1 ribokinase [Amycolatopsis mediterranei]